MATKNAERQFGTVTFESLGRAVSSLYNTAFARIMPQRFYEYAAPEGSQANQWHFTPYYQGTAYSRNNPIVENPWGTVTDVQIGAKPYTQYVPEYSENGSYLWDRAIDGPRYYQTLTLQPGQAYNLLTGQFNDPNLHANTAARLNQATALRRVNETGLSKAQQDSARNQPTTLATLDEMYWGSTQTEVTASSSLSNMQQIAAQGINTEGGKTILGAEPLKKPTSKTALNRALT